MSICISNLKHRIRTNQTVIAHGNVRDHYIGEGRLYKNIGELFLAIAREQGFRTFVTYDLVSGERRMSVGNAAELESDSRGEDDLAETAPDRSSRLGAREEPNDAIRRWLEQVQAVSERSMLVVHYADKLCPFQQSYSQDEAERLLLLEKVMQSVSADNRLILVSLASSMVPIELYRDAPTTTLFEIPSPDKLDRRAYIEHRMGETLSPDILESLAARTDGMYLKQMDGLFEQLEGGKEALTLGQVPAVVNGYRTGQKRDYWGELTPEKIRGARDYFIEKEGIKGQDQAVDAMIRAVMLARSGVNGSETKPQAAFICAGPTGVGKTMSAEKLALFLFGTEDAIVRLDMSECKESHSSSRLIGAAPGYVGYSEGGQLTKAVADKTFCVVLLDEIEKAHAEILNLFLQVLDEGHLTDGLGTRVSFSEAALIFTTNIGSRSINAHGQPCKEADELEKIRRSGGSPEQIQQQVREHFVRSVEEFFTVEISKPELLGRIGKQRILPFNHIDNRDIQKKIFLHHLSRKEAAFADKHRGKGGHTVSFEDSLVECLLDKHSEQIKTFGGRGVRNAIEDDVLGPLAFALLNAELAGGLASPIHLIGGARDGQVVFEQDTAEGEVQ